MQPLYQVQVRFSSEPQRVVLIPSTREVGFPALTRLLDDVVRNGWEQSAVSEAWLYEDGDLVAYVHEKAFQRDMEVAADGFGDAISTRMRSEKRLPRKFRKVP